MRSMNINFNYILYNVTFAFCVNAREWQRLELELELELEP